MFACVLLLRVFVLCSRFFCVLFLFVFFFFNDSATTEIYTLSLHDALPISLGLGRGRRCRAVDGRIAGAVATASGPSLRRRDRKSTRLNSSHLGISYAVFCLKKKKKKKQHIITRENYIKQS